MHALWELSRTKGLPHAPAALMDAVLVLMLILQYAQHVIPDFHSIMELVLLVWLELFQLPMLLSVQLAQLDVLLAIQAQFA